MSHEVLTRTLRDSIRPIVWWSLGIVALVSLQVAVYPSIRDNEGMKRLTEDYPEALKAFVAFGGGFDYTSPAGYLGSELFSFVLPLLLMIAAIGAGARAIAGEEEAGTLELLLANPLSRSRVVLDRLAALAGELAALCVVLWAALTVSTAAASMHIGPAKLAAAVFDAGLLAFLYGALALLAGAATGRRAIAVAVAAAAGVAAYVVNALAALVDGLEPVQKASPFYHYAVGDPLRQGLALDHAALLVGLALAVAAAAPFALARRDI
jgi:ABC-2 type transport system permease protein